MGYLQSGLFYIIISFIIFIVGNVYIHKCSYNGYYFCVAEADQILKNEQNLLRLPGGSLNFEAIEVARKKSAKS